MRSFEELQKLVIGARIVDIYRSHDGRVMVLTDLAHPEYPTDCVGIEVVATDPTIELEVYGQAVFRKAAVQ